MDEAVKIEVTGRIDGKIARSIRDIARAAIEADTNLDLLRQALRDVSSGAELKSVASDARTIRNEIRQTQGSVNALGGAVNGVARDFEQAAGSARKFNNEAKKGAASVGSIRTAANGLRNSLTPLVGTFSAIFAVHQWAQASDAVTTYTNRLRTTGLEGEALTATLDKVRDIALANGQAMDGLTLIYQRSANAARENGASQADMLKLVEATAMALRIQGGSASSAAGAMQQLAQAIGSPRVEAEELMSILDGMPAILQAAAKGSDRFGGSMQKLVNYIRSGNDISGGEFMKNIIDGMALLQEQVDRTNLTISQALTNLRTKFEQWAGGTTAATRMVVEAIVFLGDNLHIIIPAIITFGTAWAAVKMAQIITETIALTRALAAMLVPFAPLVAITVTWATVLGLVLAAILSVAYAIAVLTGNGEQFEQFIADAIVKVKDMAGNLLGLSEGSSVATEALDAMGLSQQALNSAVDNGTDALATNAAATQNWSSKATKAVNAVASAYNNLTKAKKEALAAGATQHYNELMQAGGTVGSFTAVPSAPAAGSSGSSITTLPAMRNGGSMYVGGTRRGVDRNLVAFRANRGERVDVLTKPQQRRANNQNNQPNQSPPVFNFYITTPDAESFRLSRNQIASDTFAAIG